MTRDKPLFVYDLPKSIEFHGQPDFQPEEDPLYKDKNFLLLHELAYFWARPIPLEGFATGGSTGEASVSNRKGKRIVAFELNVKCVWEGQIDYDDVSGEMLLPYISEDVDDAKDYEIKFTAKEAGDASHKKAIKFLTAQLPGLREGLAAFKDEIYKKPDKKE